ncbi:MAG: hypothetical protein K8T20_21040 [Planctomycetes bacterium]|nr:hypothetical protein [Planctomycetota bacterium]
MHQKGLTLFEIVVLLVIIAVLAAFILPAFTHTHGHSRKTDCKNSLKQIGIYFALYESKYKAYPTPGAATWFAQLWAPDMATNGNLFRCAVRGKAGAGTHYLALAGSGTWPVETVRGTERYTWGATALDDHAPADLPIAGDGDDEHGVPNHGAGDDRNILFFSGRVDVFAIGSPTEARALSVLDPPTRGWSAPAETK